MLSDTQYADRRKNVARAKNQTITIASVYAVLLAVAVISCMICVVFPGSSFEQVAQQFAPAVAVVLTGMLVPVVGSAVHSNHVLNKI